MIFSAASYMQLTVTNIRFIEDNRKICFQEKLSPPKQRKTYFLHVRSESRIKKKKVDHWSYSYLAKHKTFRLSQNILFSDNCLELYVSYTEKIMEKIKVFEKQVRKFSSAKHCKEIVVYKNPSLPLIVIYQS